MRRLFQDESTAIRGQRFLEMILEREASGNPIQTNEWAELLRELGVSRSSFYAMRNKLLGSGMITNKKGVYRISGQFSKDLVDMARWWWVAVLKRDLGGL
jgi:DNA-binding IclR family transcriptional regulator